MSFWEGVTPYWLPFGGSYSAWAVELELQILAGVVVVVAAAAALVGTVVVATVEEVVGSAVLGEVTDVWLAAAATG